jgi:hypothetical protein
MHENVRGWDILNLRPALPEKVPTHAVKILSAFLPMLGLEDVLPASIRFQAPMTRALLPELVAGSKRVVVFPESRRAEKNWMGYESLTRKHWAVRLFDSGPMAADCTRTLWSVSSSRRAAVRDSLREW